LIRENTTISQEKPLSRSRSTGMCEWLQGRYFNQAIAENQREAPAGAQMPLESFWKQVQWLYQADLASFTIDSALDSASVSSYPDW
jgi:hypothetical protein